MSDEYAIEVPRFSTYNEHVCREIAVRCVVNAVYNLHETLCHRGYRRNQERYDFEHGREFVLEQTLHLHEANLSQLSCEYRSPLDDIYVYVDIGTFNVARVRSLIHKIFIHPRNIIILSWDYILEKYMTALTTINRDYTVTNYTVTDLYVDIRHNHLSPSYELIPLDDEPEIVNDLKITTKSQLPIVYSEDPLVRQLGLSKYVGRIVREISPSLEVGYRCIVSGRNNNSKNRPL